jgi:hypothetical protein
MGDGRWAMGDEACRALLFFASSDRKYVPSTSEPSTGHFQQSVFLSSPIRRPPDVALFS